ncbi:MAG TPA: hydrogenase maturation protease [Ilumatobacteraceae bacterium]
MTTATALIGVGNPWRGDDGVGHEVVVRAGRQLTVDHEVVLCNGEPSGLLEAWSGRDLAVIVDATHGGGRPGTVRVWTDEAPAPSPAVAGSHALGVSHALALADALGRSPARLVVIGIEADDVSPGHGLSAVVAAAIDEAVALVVAAVQAGS